MGWGSVFEYLVEWVGRWYESLGELFVELYLKYNCIIYKFIFSELRNVW